MGSCCCKEKIEKTDYHKEIDQLLLYKHHNCACIDCFNKKYQYSKKMIDCF